MNLRDLAYLVAVAEELHFARAAARCHVSQPTLSMQLKKLEGTLGVQLFERTNKQVMLTSIGADIVQRARRVLAETEQMRYAARAARDPLAGQIRLGLFPTLAPYLLPGLMPALKAALPKLSILLMEEKTPVLMQQLEDGALDAAMLAMPVHHTAFDHQPLFTEPFLLAVSATHPLAGRQTVALAELRQQEMLLLEDGHCLREQALEICQTLGIGEANSFRATSLETLRHMVAAGQSVTLMPKLATARDDPALHYIAFKKPVPSRHIGLFWRKANGRSPLFTAVADIAREQYNRI